MLILAGITIFLSTGENGILRQTISAKENTDIAIIKEEIDNSIYESKTTYEPYGDIDKEILESKLQEKGFTIIEKKGENDYFPWIVRKNNYTLEIRDDKNIAQINNENIQQSNNVAQSYAITYVLNEGTNNNANPNTITSSDTIELGVPTKAKYEFLGWYEQSDFSGDPITTLSNVSSDITLYAKWNRISKIYFQMPTDWTGDTVYAYLWNENNKDYKNSAWPGELMTREDTEENSNKYIFSYEVEEEKYDSIVEDNYTNVIFGNGDPTTRQTVNLDFSENQLCNIFAPELYNGTSDIRVFFSGSTSWKPHLYLWNR